MTSTEATVAERLASFERGAQELSAARLARDVASMLEKAFRAKGGKQKDLAASLGVTDGAVTQVLRGDGNVRIATLGRYLRALGYEAQLSLKPVTPGAASITASPTRRRARTSDKTGCTVPVSPGTSSTVWTVLDADGDLFGVKVRLTDSMTPGRQKFSGECQKVRPLMFTDARAVNGGHVEPLGKGIEEHAELLVGQR